jgi:transcriptional regulator with XRE-family HTH domain
MRDMQIIGKKIKQLRQKRDWNQGDVAGKLNLSIPAMSKIETGVTDINIARLIQIARVFEISLMELLSIDNEYAFYVESQESSELKAKLIIRDQEIIQLQEKLIDLYELLKDKD